MSILIKGMEMPKDCWHCRFADPEEGGCLVDQKTHGDWDEPDNCPLVDVPPHGDLIDRYDLKNKEITIDYDEWDDTFEDGLLFVADLIDDAPTIIPADKEGEG